MTYLILLLFLSS